MDLVGGAMDPRGGYISKILHVKTKESGPVGGGARRARPPRSANVLAYEYTGNSLIGLKCKCWHSTCNYVRTNDKVEIKVKINMWFQGYCLDYYSGQWVLSVQTHTDHTCIKSE